MQEKYRNMAPEECAARFKRNRILSFIIYILVLITIGAFFLKRAFYIFPLMNCDLEIVEIYHGLDKANFSLFLIRVVVCFLVMAIVLSMQELFFFGIFITLCEPDKYINAEQILSRHNFFFRRYYKFAIINLGLAYSSIEDYENAWNYYKKIIPASPERCSNIRILTALASYFYDSGDKENATLYRARLDNIKASNKKSLQLDLTLDNFIIREALDNKQFDEAKELINKYINNHRVSQLTKIHYQYYLGLIAYETKDYPEAIYRFRTALENGSKLPFAGDANAKLEEICKSYHV
ncbi:hypothetical protein D6856_10565 [Butyrivibrio sp. XB500-5]|uniref:tetratricopeptide repeat protein n=1 Tax=Butyrivibrio sp. XB500-5 TaxID=2364880 RepID=UPI000EA90C43|nr:tetratricopeptide repeat protein [Butyrivibrio sp. XB500-5]RKM59647.1 hypothetical protein D6856_10565 [Butyrivibrio sp. XB500-5]